ncbi:MAG: hypothetical protein ABI461_16160 [Polyangiaceae bacterium]
MATSARAKSSPPPKSKGDRRGVGSSAGSLTSKAGLVKATLGKKAGKALESETSLKTGSKKNTSKTSPKSGAKSGKSGSIRPTGPHSAKDRPSSIPAPALSTKRTASSARAAAGQSIPPPNYAGDGAEVDHEHTNEDADEAPASTSSAPELAAAEPAAEEEFEEVEAAVVVDEDVEPVRPKPAARIDEGGGDSMLARYFREMATHHVMGPEEELTTAIEVEQG